ncbi:recombinase family protein [Streptacidiphilus sp. PAMC 29251]
MSTLSAWDDFEVPPMARRGQVTLNLHDHLTAYVPKRPAAYLRISSDRFGLEAGVDRQQVDADDTRKRLRWPEFTKVYKENDTSAFKKKKMVKDDGTIDWVVVRPQFRQLLADLAAGIIDGVIFYDLDRLVRGATGGHMNLINDSDRHMARIMCVMALKSSEGTSRRAARMHLASAQDGKIQGRIAYGWVRKGLDKGKRIASEAELVTRIYLDCLSGKTSYAIATDLNRKGVQAPAAKLWSSTMVNKMLRNPRYAGMVSYAGQHRVDAATDWDGWSKVLFDDAGRPLLGCWEQIIAPKDWSQVQFELQLRRQKRGLGPEQSRPAVALKYLMSGIFECGRCGRGLVGGWPGRKADPNRREYYCPPSARGGCNGTSIAAETAEGAVDEAIVAYLSKLFEQPTFDDYRDPARIQALNITLEEESTRKHELIRRWTEGALADVGLAEDDYFQMLGGVNRKISALRVEIAGAEGEGPSQASLEEILHGWHNGTLQQRRAILKRYLHGIVIVAPAPTGDRSAGIKDRLKPRWKTMAELAA